MSQNIYFFFNSTSVKYIHHHLSKYIQCVPPGFLQRNISRVNGNKCTIYTILNIYNNLFIYLIKFSKPIMRNYQVIKMYIVYLATKKYIENIDYKEN